MPFVETSAAAGGGGIPDPVTSPITVAPTDQDVAQAIQIVFDRLAAADIDGALRITNGDIDVHLWSTSADYTITANDDTVTALLRLTSANQPLNQVNIEASDNSAKVVVRGISGNLHTLQAGSDGSGQIGFYATSPIAQQTVTKAGITAGQLWDILNAYGLVAEP